MKKSYFLSIILLLIATNVFTFNAKKYLKKGGRRAGQRSVDNHVIRTMNKTIRGNGIRASLFRTNSGIAVRFKGKVLFRFGSYRLLPRAKRNLIKIAGTLRYLRRKYPFIKFRCEGHSDYIGSRRAKYLFSVRRAKAVANYLIYRGVNRRKVSFKGLSDRSPIDRRRSNYARARNRRVEIIIITRVGR